MDRVYRFLMWLVVLTALSIGVLRATAIRWWKVPQGDPELAASIAPSLRAGDWTLLWRLTRPGVGDLVLCPDPDDPTAVVIGRLAAEAFDEVEILGQEVRLNDKIPDTEYNCTEKALSIVSPDTGKTEQIFCEMESIGDRLHMRGHSANKGTRRKYKKQVESGKAFLLSDNRAYPFDSRHFGTLERRNCKETIFFRLFGAEGFLRSQSRFEVVR